MIIALKTMRFVLNIVKPINLLSLLQNSVLISNFNYIIVGVLPDFSFAKALMKVKIVKVDSRKCYFIQSN